MHIGAGLLYPIHLDLRYHMRSSKNRSRSKSNRQRSLGNIVNRVFDSSGPEGKVRGTPQQIIEKYLGLARDSQLSNDRVAEQNFLQHAEHYTRMLGEAQRDMQREQELRQQQNGQEGGAQNGNGGPSGGQPQQSVSDDRGGDRGGDRQQYNRRRHEDQRGDRNDRGGEDFRRSAQGDEAQGDDDGPGLVETPETRVSPLPTSSMMADLSEVAESGAAAAPKPAAARRPRKPRVKAEAVVPEAPPAASE